MFKKEKCEMFRAIKFGCYFSTFAEEFVLSV